jgi:hypothetical protein
VVSEETGEVLYHNTFATNHSVTEQTVRDTVTAGRCRWKIENEGNNVLKNQGYHFEHNFGHGEKNLSMVLLSLLLLAFLCHTVLHDLPDHSGAPRHAQGILRRHSGADALPGLCELGCADGLHAHATAASPTLMRRRLGLMVYICASPSLSCRRESTPAP